MSDDEFEKLVSDAIEEIPKRFLERLDNVAIVTALHPSRAQLHKQRLNPAKETLLGLYEGVPLTERGDVYGMGEILPDKITIFKEPILQTAHEEKREVGEVVRDTVWHEIAHYFGYNDAEILHREIAGTNHSIYPTA